jgi:Putative transposase of IS4/5 family (DUF4096)
MTKAHKIDFDAACNAAKALGMDADLFLAVLSPGEAATPAERSKLGDLDDAEWKTVRDCLPVSIRSAKGIRPRWFIDGCLYRWRHRSVSWRRLPDRYGRGCMLRQRFDRWTEAGHWADLIEALRHSGLSRARLAEFEGVTGIAQENRDRREEIRAARQKSLTRGEKNE